MKTEKLYDGITGIRDDIVEKADKYVFRKRKRSYTGIAGFGVMAACACLLVMITLPHLAGGGSSSDRAYGTEGIPAEEAERAEAPAQAVEDAETKEQVMTEATREENGSSSDFMCLFPSMVLAGYEAEEDAGVYEDVVLQAKYYNEELQDEMTITIAHKEWFGEEMLDAQPGRVYYRETLDSTGSYIYIDGGECIVEYSFSTRDIAGIEEFYDMVYSAPYFAE